MRRVRIETERQEGQKWLRDRGRKKGGKMKKENKRRRIVTEMEEGLRGKEEQGRNKEGEQRRG